MLQKSEVNGVNCHPLYQYMRRNSELYNEKDDTCGEIPWNFAKFILNGQGHVVSYHGPKTPPNDLESEIKKMMEWIESSILNCFKTFYSEIKTRDALFWNIKTK